MTHGRKPRRPRRISLDPVRLARNGATRLTPPEIASAIDPLRAAARALARGVATEMDWFTAASAMNVAQGIERQGVVRGLSEHVHGAEVALREIQRRAMASGAWLPPELHVEEIERIDTAVDLHEFQLQQLSYSEFRQVVVRLEAEIRGNGGCVLQVAAGAPA